MDEWGRADREVSGAMARRLTDTPIPDGVHAERADRRRVVEERGAKDRDGPVRERAAARGAHAVVTALMVLGSLQVLFLFGVEAVRYVHARTDVVRLQQQVGQLEAEAAELQAVADHANDASYRESLARLQGYMYPDEVRAISSDAPTRPPAPAPLPRAAPNTTP